MGGGSEDSGSASTGGGGQDATVANKADGGSAGEGGGGGGGDGGGSGGGTGFLGETTPFAPNPPTTTAAAGHAAVGQPAQTPTTDCGTCHGPAAVVPFLAAGFVASAAGATTPAVDVEVRVYVGGTGYSAQTDTNGFFWINPPAAGVTGTLQGGVRGAGGTPVIMPSAQAAPYDCQSSTCHGGATGNIHYP